MRFLPLCNPARTVLDAAAALEPTNPFVTAPYVAFRRRSGAQPWALCVEEDERLVSACAAFMRTGFVNRELEIASLPQLPDAEPFWPGVIDLCTRQRVTLLRVCSFGSAPSPIPPLPGEQSRHRRAEFVVDLHGTDLWAQLTPHHRRTIGRARKRGLRIRRTTDGGACDVHASLIQTSMHRREARGEAVPLEFPSDEFRAMMQSGAGELFQVLDDGGEVLSSVLVLRAARGAYVQTSGTNALGMASGASPMLLHETANILQREGMELFNLGGARPAEEGLRRFKLAFGTRMIELESADFSFAGPMTRAVTRLARRVRQSLHR
jgi:hypothetical protein